MNMRKQLAKGSSVVSVITFMGHLLSMGLKVLISRVFGIAGFGQYALIMAFSRFLSTVVQMGYHQSIVHFISKFRTKQDWVNGKRFFVLGTLHIIIVSTILLATLLIFRERVLGYIKLENGGYHVLLYISGISTAIAINNFISGSLRSLKLFVQQTLLFTSAFPILMITSLIFVKFLPINSAGIYQFLAIGILLNAIMLVIVFMLTKLKFAHKDHPQFEKEDIKQLPRYSMPIWLSSSLQTASASADRIMLGIFSSISEVGIYTAGLTFSILFDFPLKAMGPVFQPYIIEAYTKNDFEGINKLYNTMVRWSSFFVIPIYSGLLCFGDHLILAFGKNFEGAYVVMMILSFAQMMSSISGIAGTILNMTEKQTTHARILSLGFAITIILNLILIPRFGALGAAISNSTYIISINFFRVRKIVKFFALKTDYSILFWLILKFTPLVLFTFWMTHLALVHWMVLLGGFGILSVLIVYFSLSQNEKNYVSSIPRKLIGSHDGKN